MAIPLGNQLILRCLNGPNVNIVKGKQIAFTVCVKNTSIFHKNEQINVQWGNNPVNLCLEPLYPIYPLLINHESSNIYIFNAPIPSNPWWNSKFLYSIHEALQDCTCWIVSETLYVNYCSTIPTNAAVQTNLQGINLWFESMCHRWFGFFNIIQTSLNCIFTPYGAVYRIDSL